MNAQKIISKFFYSIPECHHSWREYPRDLARECEAAERQHRKGRPFEIRAPRGFSVADAGRYFAAKYLGERLSTLARAAGLVDLYVGDDGLIYQS